MRNRHSARRLSVENLESRLLLAADNGRSPGLGLRPCAAAQQAAPIAVIAKSRQAGPLSHAAFSMLQQPLAEFLNNLRQLRGATAH